MDSARNEQGKPYSNNIKITPERKSIKTMSYSNSFPASLLSVVFTGSTIAGFLFPF